MYFLCEIIQIDFKLKDKVIPRRRVQYYAKQGVPPHWDKFQAEQRAVIGNFH